MHACFVKKLDWLLTGISVLLGPVAWASSSPDAATLPHATLAVSIETGP
jgi:hypothetical protein